MSNQADHTIVRLRVPPELKEKIEKSAEENNRSQSAEMVARIEGSFEEQIPDSIASTAITAYLLGLVGKYEAQRDLHRAFLPKAEEMQDKDTIDMLNSEADRCEVLIKELKEQLRYLRSIYHSDGLETKKAP